jgi:hypothetical protein
LHARPNPLIGQGLHRVCGNVCRGRSSYYLPLPELGAPPGLDGLFFAVELLEPEPEVPLAPDGLELPDAEVPPPDDPC